MTSFALWIVSPIGYLHSRCFEEVALSLQAAFKMLWYDVPVQTSLPVGYDKIMVLGANLLPRMDIALPNNLILYNLEQIAPDSAWMNKDYIALLKRYPVWDYSQQNVETLQSVYGIHARLCGIGYMPDLTHIAPQPEDIDVLFIGSMSERRKKLLEAIAAAGSKVTAAFNSYGKERDALISQAKIVLNTHYYEAQVFEIVRVSFLLANKKCVVSETGKDAALEAPFKDGVVFATYDAIAEQCTALLKDDVRRKSIAEAGFACMQKLSQVDMLRRALNAK